jgi:hypothetical protein
MQSRSRRSGYANRRQIEQHAQLILKLMLKGAHATPFFGSIPYARSFPSLAAKNVTIVPGRPKMKARIPPKLAVVVLCPHARVSDVRYNPPT